MAAEVTDLRRYQREASKARAAWPAACLESEERFGRPAARLYPLLGVENGVKTPLGPGTLLQAFDDSPGEARPGAMVLHLRPRSWLERWRGGKLVERRPAADFVPVEEVEPYRRGGS